MILQLDAVTGEGCLTHMHSPALTNDNMENGSLMIATCLLDAAYCSIVMHFDVFCVFAQHH